MKREFLRHITVKIDEFLQPELIRLSTNQIYFKFFTELSEILTDFRDRDERVCFFAYPVIPSVIVAHQNIFYQNFRLKKTFPDICNKVYLSI